MQHEFTLTVDRDPTDLAEELFEVAQGNLIPEGGSAEHHDKLVHAFVEAETLGDAITTAVRQVESTGLAVTGLQAEDLVTAKDIAEHTGRTYESVRLLATGQRGPGGFPAPVAHGQWSLYSWVLVRAWFAQHYGAEECETYDREIAAADHVLRARYLIPRQRRDEFMQLLRS